jgi:type I restriction enzyme R subunit
MVAMSNSQNFSHLNVFDAQLVRLGSLAERYFSDDPVTTLIKLRQFGELLAQMLAAKLGLYEVGITQAELLKKFKQEGILNKQLADAFHFLRLKGNIATHEHQGNHQEALSALKIAHQLGIWFQRSFGADKAFSTGVFAPPQNPDTLSTELQKELEALRQALKENLTEKDRIEAEATEREQELLTAQQKAEKEAEEKVFWEQTAQEAEQAKQAIEAELKALQRQAESIPTAQVVQAIQLAQSLGNQFTLDEAATRALIDQQLRDKGWEAESKTLRYSEGTRPSKGRNIAIAEWPTASGPADYALFVGLQCVGLAEAKKHNKNVSSVIDQAERYSRGFSVNASIELEGAPWPDGQADILSPDCKKGAFQVPFVFSTNGRPYLKQLEEESGIWFRDVRKPFNHRRALMDWYTPQGLTELLEMDIEKAQAELKAQTFDFGFVLRHYQKKAIQSVEAGLEDQRRQMLIAMATGTGKTKLAIAMLYRLLSAKRFRRVCFVVDRSALGNQTAGEFKTTKVVSVRTFADIFGIKELRDVIPDPETKVHICTIQGLVKRVLYATEPSEVPPIDQYDLIVVDECHRGYTLDRELSDAELEFRSEADYVSKYRRVLEHFDAVKIGLTATPALHTVDIFGQPIYTYSYREAVVDGFLIDHEPPIRIETALSQAGIEFKQGEDLPIFDTGTGMVDLTIAPDDLHFDVEEFNRKVITKPFNRAVAEALADYIDPADLGKTLIFAVNKGHADILVSQIKAVFKERFGEVEDAAIRRITGDTDKVQDVILQFRNDPLPKIAVTVDLLTTGVDVPSITNLVFVRRVNSRILYEQMLGRATRQCPDIEKETFRIFDAVDLYKTLEPVTAMKPVVTNPSISLSQLFEELQKEAAAEHRQVIIDQIVVKLRRRLKKLSQQAAETYEAEIGETPQQTLERLRNQSPNVLADWAKNKPSIGPILDWNPEGKQGSYLPISHHDDSVLTVSRGYGRLEDGEERKRPEDFLDSFTSYIRNNMNEIAALKVVTQRPRDLTRAELKSLKLELDRMGFSETYLRRAWQDARNQDIAASIIGFVRQAALGDALIDYDIRVRNALTRILQRQSWTENQRKWLKRIGDQFIKEVVVDREALNSGQFKVDTGGFVNLNKQFNGQLEALLGDINEEIWRQTA